MKREVFSSPSLLLGDSEARTEAAGEKGGRLRERGGAWCTRHCRDWFSNQDWLTRLQFDGYFGRAIQLAAELIGNKLCFDMAYTATTSTL